MAVRTLIRWASDNPDREGSVDTPARVVPAYDECFAGYGEDPAEFLQRKFVAAVGYDEMIVQRNISFLSHCEHHMAPTIAHTLVTCLAVVSWEFPRLLAS